MSVAPFDAQLWSIELEDQRGGNRVKYADRVVVISGDTVLTTPLAENSKNADLLVAEVMNMGCRSGMAE